MVEVRVPAVAEGEEVVGVHLDGAREVGEHRRGQGLAGRGPLRPLIQPPANKRQRLEKLPAKRLGEA